MWHYKSHLKTVLNYDSGIKVPGRKKRKAKPSKGLLHTDSFRKLNDIYSVILYILTSPQTSSEQLVCVIGELWCCVSLELVLTGKSMCPYSSKLNMKY